MKILYIFLSLLFSSTIIAQDINLEWAGSIETTSYESEVPFVATLMAMF